MKNICLVILCLLAFISCDKPSIVNSTLIQGTWRWTGSTTDVASMSPTPASVGYEMTYTFHENNTVTIITDTFVRIDTYRLVPNATYQGKSVSNMINIRGTDYLYDLTSKHLKLVMAYEEAETISFEK